MSLPPRSEAAAAAVDDGVWDALRAVIGAIYRRDAAELRRAQDLDVVHDRASKAAFGGALTIMAFAVIGSRIDHRPMTDEDAVEVADSVYPLPDGFRPMSYSDILDTVRAVIHLPTGPTFDLGHKLTADTAIAITMFIVGLRINDMAEFEGMRVDVGRWLIHRGITRT